MGFGEEMYRVLFSFLLILKLLQHRTTLKEIIKRKIPQVKHDFLIFHFPFKPTSLYIKFYMVLFIMYIPFYVMLFFYNIILNFFFLVFTYFCFFHCESIERKFPQIVNPLNFSFYFPLPFTEKQLRMIHMLPFHSALMLNPVYVLQFISSFYIFDTQNTF